MSEPSIYLPGQSWLHRLHPLTKLTFCLAALLIIFGGPGRWQSAAIPGLAAWLMLWHAGLAGRVIKRMIPLIAPLAVVLFLVHGLFGPDNRTNLFAVGPFKIGQEGLFYAGLIVLRLVSAFAASLMLIMSTHPAHIIQALVEMGMPNQLAYLLGSPLLLLPQFAGRIRTIRAAQQSRGLETQGSVIQRARALFPLIAPLVFSALVDVEEHALALEVRGFSAPGKKTSLSELMDTPIQRTARWIMALLASLLLLIGLYRRAFGIP